MDYEVDRYIGVPTSRYAYMKEFLVHCPKCNQLAVIKTAQPDDPHNDKLICHTCKHSEKSSDIVRYNAIVKRNCDSCGQPMDITIANNKEKVEELTIPCSHCGQVRTYQPRNDVYKLTYKNSGICDPVFNLPLWFQYSIKGEIFWAYNREHLAEIRSYVSAKLRERQTTTHTTMVERLPNFIKAAKNRLAILRAIDKLLKK